MFMALAPADNSCSHAGTFGCGLVKLTMPITSGASLRRLRSVSIRRLGSDGQTVLPTADAIAALVEEATPPDVKRARLEA